MLLGPAISESMRVKPLELSSLPKHSGSFDSSLIWGMVALSNGCLVTFDLVHVEKANGTSFSPHLSMEWIPMESYGRHWLWIIYVIFYISPLSPLNPFTFNDMYLSVTSLVLAPTPVCKPREISWTQIAVNIQSMKSPQDKTQHNFRNPPRLYNFFIDWDVTLWTRVR